jgi:hypothetical protein
MGKGLSLAAATGKSYCERSLAIDRLAIDRLCSLSHPPGDIPA